MSDYYTPKAASELTGASRQILRTYTQRYARYLSNDATPEAGQGRRFSDADLKVIAFVYQRTSAGETHEQVLERLAAGELEQFTWQAPAPDPTPQAPESTGSALVPFERLQTAHALMLDAQRREQLLAEQTAAQVAILQAEVQRLTLALGRAEGEAATLKAARYRAPKWVRSIFGGRSE